MTTPKNLGMILLAIFLILFGLFTNSFLKINFDYKSDVMAVLAVVTGVMLFLQR